jgi:hypothetical protein
VADNVDLQFSRLDAKLDGLDVRVEAFRETVTDRFDQTVELLKASVRTLREDIQSLRKG